MITSMSFVAVSASAETVIISNKGVSSKSLTASSLKKIFLGKMRTYPDGGKVKPVDQKTGSPSHTVFYSRVIKKNATELKSYWAKLIFSGKGRPPKQLDGDSAVKAWVEKTTGAIGYIDSKAVDETVKILFKIE